MSSSQLKLFATTPKGLELLLVDELRSIGATDPAEKLAGVTFTGNLELAYKACLWSRLANRILLQLAQVPAATPEELYAGVQTIAWDNHINPDGTLNVNFICSQSKITHTLYGAQKVKDAIVDQLRDKFNVRPNVTRTQPDISIHVYLHRDIATISLDLSGESLHKRGYRLEQGAAPLKENLAAAILLRAGWKSIVEQGGMLLDPMCGSGTLLIEAALLAGNIAPGLLRDYYGFLGWKQHDAKIWDALVKQANQSCHIAQIPTIVGYDIDPHAIKIAFANIERAGLHGKIHVEKCELSSCVPKKSTGLLVVNPPYGERLGDLPELQNLYARLGEKLKNEFSGWQAAVFTGNPDLGKNMGLRARKHYALFNGAIPCQLLLFDVSPEYYVDRSPEANNERRIRRASKSLTEKEQQNAQMFANRIRKNNKNIKRWLEQEHITNYRIYDADLPEYAVAVDIYEKYVCVTEYPVPKTIDKNQAERRLQQVLAVLPDALGVLPATIFLRDLSNHLNSLDELFQVTEDAAQFYINLTDGNWEVGLPLEQRILRQHIKQAAHQKKCLSVFTRSGVMPVCAALGGATSVKSIVQNEACLSWTKKNMTANGVNGQVVLAESMDWLQNERSRYDLIIVEFPWQPFYREEHPEILRQLVDLLAPNGELFLLTQDYRFKLSKELYSEFTIDEITQQILPVDFKRNPKIQQCWRIT